MKITLEWLDTNQACAAGKQWFLNQTQTNSVAVLKSLVLERHYDWANWTICRLFTHKQKVRYAIFAAEKVIAIYEAQYPGNKQPREAIEAAKKWVKRPTIKNQNAANAAATAAYAATAANAYVAYVAYAAADAAYAATAADAYAATVYAANAAATAANAAATAADAATVYAANAAATAADAYAAKERLQCEILEFGLKLLTAKRAVKVSQFKNRRLIK